MITFKFCIPCYFVRWMDKRFQFLKYLEDYWGEYNGYTFTEEIENETYIDDCGYFYIGKYRNEYDELDELNGCYCVPLFIGRIISWFNRIIK